MNERRYELDWLRALAILVVFLYHSMRFFNLEDWGVKNADTYVWVEAFLVFINRWMMPLFFIISGASLFHAMDKPGGFKKFYSNKFLRLMIPVLVAVITHAAVQIYLDRLSHHRFSGSFVSFISQYLNGLYLEIGSIGNFPFHGMHLWYLLLLFIYSLLCYGPFLWLKGAGAGLLDRAAKLAAVPGLMYLWLALPLAVIKALIPHPVLSVGQGGWGFLYYIWFLMAGFIIMSSDHLQRRIKEQRLTSLALGAIFISAYIFQAFTTWRPPVPESLYDWMSALLNFLSAWCLLTAILGYGMQYLSFDRPFLRRANEGVLPFYIMHQSVLVIVGYWVIAWNIPDFLKWIVISAVSFSILITVYILLIKRYDFLRFLFGMKTVAPFYAVFAKRNALIGFHALYLGLLTYALVAQIAGPAAGRTMPLAYDPQRDVILDYRSITDESSGGVKIVDDKDASEGRAMEFQSGAASRLEPRPDVFVDLTFDAPAGNYVVWLRGKAYTDDIMTDSIRLQWDRYIGTTKGISSLGNWNDLHPSGAYVWASNGYRPVSLVLKHSGRHMLRLQPRQTPHRIDQIWLSRFQWAVPDTSAPVNLRSDKNGRQD